MDWEARLDEAVAEADEKHRGYQEAWDRGVEEDTKLRAFLLNLGESVAGRLWAEDVPLSPAYPDSDDTEDPDLWVWATAASQVLLSPHGKWWSSTFYEMIYSYSEVGDELLKKRFPESPAVFRHVQPARFQLFKNAQDAQEELRAEAQESIRTNDYRVTMIFYPGDDGSYMLAQRSKEEEDGSETSRDIDFAELIIKAAADDIARTRALNDL